MNFVYSIEITFGFLDYLYNQHCSVTSQRLFYGLINYKIAGTLTIVWMFSNQHLAVQLYKMFTQTQNQTDTLSYYNLAKPENRFRVNSSGASWSRAPKFWPRTYLLFGMAWGAFVWILLQYFRQKTTKVE